jgi:uncharacterized protein YbjT (DUF2867 family)
MRVLLTGANGFIGRYLLAHLIDTGHQVVCAVRKVGESRLLNVSEQPIAVDFNRDTNCEDWLPRLAGIDAVINCAGILHPSRGQSIDAIHAAAPQALFTACEQAGVRRVIQISAISAEPGAGTAYADTKRRADEFLKTRDLDWVIVRPSLVYASGAYGGTALLRALAALPFAIPVVGKGDQAFQPIHVSDVAKCVSRVLGDHNLKQVVIDPVGPETLTLREILVSLRGWLGFDRAPVVEIPLWLITPIARLGDFFGGPLNSTALRQLQFGNTGDIDGFVAIAGISPKQWSQVLSTAPSQWQDRWHARLYFLRPLLRWILGLMWVASGVIGLQQPATVLEPLASTFGISGQASVMLATIACFIDLAIGIALWLRWRLGAVAAIQLGVIGAYTLVLSLAIPSLWLDPYGPLLKNLPIAVAVLVLAALEQDR